MTASRDAAHFERLYARDPDPWKFTTSAYEQAKFDATVAMIADRHYGAALEVGCSIGVLSHRIAPLCGDFLGIDITEMPLVAARDRCRDLPQARFARVAVPAEWPEGVFDLILLSEVLYFLTEDDALEVTRLVLASLRPSGRVLLVNWTGRLDDPQQGEAAAAGFIAASGLAVARGERSDGYRIDLLSRP